MNLFTPRPGAQVWLWAFGATLVFVALLAFIHTWPGTAKRRLTIIVTFAAGLFYFLEFMLPPGTLLPNREPGSQDNRLTLYLPGMSDFFMVVGALALGLGILNLARINGRALARMQRGWHNSAIFFVGLFGMIVVGLYNAYLPEHEGWKNWYDLLFGGLYTSLVSSVFALLAFFIATAAFRAFRFNSTEATLMMITAFIVMLGNVGSEVLTGRFIPPDSPIAFLRLDNITFWIMTTVNMSAQRALLFGIAMGELAIALRVWLSLERGHFFDQEV